MTDTVRIHIKAKISINTSTSAIKISGGNWLVLRSLICDQEVGGSSPCEIFSELFLYLTTAGFK